LLISEKQVYQKALKQTYSDSIIGNYMPKKLLAITTIILLAIEFLSLINVVGANFNPVPQVYIASPRERYVYPWITYEKTCIPLEIAVIVPEDLPIARVLYSLDGEVNITLTDITNRHAYWIDFCEVSFGSNLTNLREGNHTLTAYSVDNKGEVLSATRNFAVGSSTFYSQPSPSTFATHTTPPPKGSFDYFIRTLPSYTFVLMGIFILTVAALCILALFKWAKAKTIQQGNVNFISQQQPIANGKV
jgi:hypothetical protein